MGLRVVESIDAFPGPTPEEIEFSKNLILQVSFSGERYVKPILRAGGGV